MPIEFEFALGVIYFNTKGEPDDLGCLWGMPTPDGWDSAEFRGQSFDLAFADGADIPDAFDGARIIHAQGTVVGPSAAALAQAKSRLLRETRLMDTDGQFIGHSDDGGPDRFCWVRRGGKTAFPQRYDAYSMDFDFVLIAGDPRKYSVDSRTVTVASSTTVGGVQFPVQFPVIFTTDADTLSATAQSTNAGDMPAPYVATFAGPLVNPVLIDTRNQLRLPLNISIPLGRTVVVDTLLQTIDEDETPVFGAYDTLKGSDLDLLRIPAADEYGNPGLADWLLLGQGSGTCSITSHDVYQ